MFFAYDSMALGSFGLLKDIGCRQIIGPGKYSAGFPGICRSGRSAELTPKPFG
jgi:hypothetical protein